VQALTQRGGPPLPTNRANALMQTLRRILFSWTIEVDDAPLLSLANPLKE
jgi:hypothetical protein